MNTRTGEIFGFKNKQELDKAKEKNSYLVEVNCKKICEFREDRNGRDFCIANRQQRRAIKCYIPKPVIK